MGDLTEANIAVHDAVAPYRALFKRAKSKLAQALSCTDQAIQMGVEQNVSIDDMLFIKTVTITSIDEAIIMLQEKKAEVEAA